MPGFIRRFFGLGAMPAAVRDGVTAADSTLGAMPAAGETDDPLAAALRRSDDRPVLLFKHSTRCGTSYWARREVLRLDRADDPPVVEFVVQTDREQCHRIASELGIRHASPQAILLHRQRPVWNASHGHVTADAVRRAAASLT